jgi:hypothetical protein
MIHRFCARDFTPQDMELIRQIVAAPDRPSRSEISRRVCLGLNWVRPNGRLKDMSCRVALLRMHRQGLIALPQPQSEKHPIVVGRRPPEPGPTPQPFVGSVEQLQDLRLEAVCAPRQSRLWNELIARHHYLGYTPLNGEQVRYLIVHRDGILGALGFGSAAWQMAPRDRWIGWDAATRQANLQYLAHNNRFLILPWIQVKNLASKALALAAQRIGHDWRQRYRHPVVLLETLVEKDRFQATCYRAANWIRLGQTKGRGKYDKSNRQVVPIKEVYVLPLTRSPLPFLNTVASQPQES